MSDVIYLFYKNGDQYIKYQDKTIKSEDPDKTVEILKRIYDPKKPQKSNIDNLFDVISKPKSSSQTINILDYVNNNDLSDTFIGEQKITLEEVQELRKNLKQTLELTDNDIKEIHMKASSNSPALLRDIGIILFVIAILISAAALLLLNVYI